MIALSSRLSGACTPAPTTPMFVYIDYPVPGQGVIFVGEQRFGLKNPVLIQTLRAAIG